MNFEEYNVVEGADVASLVDAELQKETETEIYDTAFSRLSTDDGNQDMLLVNLFDEKGDLNVVIRAYYEGVDYLCYRLRMPIGYMARCPSNLVSIHFNHWLRETKDRPIRAIVHDGCAVAFVTDRYAYIPNKKVIEGIQGIPNVKVVKWALSPVRMAALVEADNRTPDTVQHLRKGDEAHLGMTITNSDTGWGQLGCEGVISVSDGGWFIIPTRSGGFKKRHLGDPDLLWEEFSKVWDDLTSNFAAIAKRLKAMTKEVIAAVEEDGIVGQIIDLLGLPAKRTLELMATGKDTTTLSILERLLKLADDPDYASYADKIRRAAGEWVITEDASSPLWVTI